MIPFLLFTQELTNWDSFKSPRMKASFPLKVSQMEVFAKGSSLKKKKEKKKLPSSRYKVALIFSVE